MNVPIARYAPRAESSSPDPVVRLVCPLSGSVDYWSNSAQPAESTSDSWPKPSLKALYRTHQEYLSKFTQATHDAVAAGYLLEPDANEAIDQAAVSEVGN